MPKHVKESKFVGKGAGSVNRKSIPSDVSSTGSAPTGVGVVANGKAKGSGKLNVTKMMNKGTHHTT